MNLYTIYTSQYLINAFPLFRIAKMHLTCNVHMTGEDDTIVLASEAKTNSKMVNCINKSIVLPPIRITWFFIIFCVP